MNVEKVLDARAKVKELGKQLNSSNTSNASWIKREKFTNAIEDLAIAARVIERTDTFKTDVAVAVRKYIEAATEFNEGLDRFKDRAVRGNAVAQSKLNTLKSAVDIAEIELEGAKDLLTVKSNKINDLIPLINEKIIPILPKSGGFRKTRVAKRKARGTRKYRR
jgi:hypothetical protein